MLCGTGSVAWNPVPYIIRDGCVRWLRRTGGISAYGVGMLRCAYVNEWFIDEDTEKFDQVSEGVVGMKSGC